MPKQLKKRRRIDEVSQKSKFVSQQDPDESWCNNQMADTMDNSTACGTVSIKGADFASLTSKIFDSAAMNWI